MSASIVRIILAAHNIATLQMLMLIQGRNNSNKACLNCQLSWFNFEISQNKRIADTSEAHPEIMITNSSKPNDYKNNYNKNQKFKKNSNKSQYNVEV